MVVTHLKNFSFSDPAHTLRTGLSTVSTPVVHTLHRLTCRRASVVHRRHARIYIIWPIDNGREPRRTLPPVAAQANIDPDDTQRPQRRICARRGCAVPVNKATAKYCSVRCCSLDPERHARLSVSARRSTRRVIPMTRQLSLGLMAANNPEAALAMFSEAREDVPRGMSRLCS